MEIKGNIITYTQTGNIQTYFIFLENHVRNYWDADHNYWFNLEESCDVLGYSNEESYRMTKSRLLKKFKKDFIREQDRGTFVHEAIAYYLAFNSQKMIAKLFTLWVTSKVLPLITTTGEYKGDMDECNLIIYRTLAENNCAEFVNLVNEMNRRHLEKQEKKYGLAGVAMYNADEMLDGVIINIFKRELVRYRNKKNPMMTLKRRLLRKFRLDKDKGIVKPEDMYWSDLLPYFSLPVCSQLTAIYKLYWYWVAMNLFPWDIEEFVKVRYPMYFTGDKEIFEPESNKKIIQNEDYSFSLVLDEDFDNSTRKDYVNKDANQLIHSIFKDRNKKLRSFEANDTIYFSLSDIQDILEINNPNLASDLYKEEDEIRDFFSNPENMLLINNEVRKFISKKYNVDINILKDMYKNGDNEYDAEGRKVVISQVNQDGSLNNIINNMKFPVEVRNEDGTPKPLSFYTESYFDIPDFINNLSQFTTIPNLDKRPNIIMRNLNNEQSSRNMTFISLPLVFKLILRSRNAYSLKFTKWVIFDILPNIRKYGNFSIYDSRVNEVVPSYLKKVRYDGDLRKALEGYTLGTEEDHEQLIYQFEQFINFLIQDDKNQSDRGEEVDNSKNYRIYLCEFCMTALKTGVHPKEMSEFLFRTRERMIKNIYE